MNNFIKPIVFCLAILCLVACRGDEPKRMPDTIPDITGIINNLTQAEGDEQKERLQILVQASKAKETTYKEASIKVTDDTLIEDENGKRLKGGQLRQGQSVEVWFDGAVMESIPVQAKAKAIRVSLNP